MTHFMKFPQGFTWGTATAAYQIEGASREDGRSDSIWDVFSRTPGKVDNGDTGEVACDHYHRWREDVRLMQELGFTAYRFSLAWPRILPDGRGKVNQPGIDFYSRLVDELLAANIQPLATLYHWDLPASLPDGWLNRATADAFAEYADVITRVLGDRVKTWNTINEPFCASFVSYKMGKHAPGLQDTGKALIAAHHLLLAHGLAVPIIHANSGKSRVGITLNQGPIYTATRSPQDLDAARHEDGELIRWFIDPLYGRHYPADMLRDYVNSGALKSVEPDFILPGDMETIAVPTDFLSLNYYTRNIVDTSEKTGESIHHADEVVYPNETHTAMGWEIFPYGLYETICRVFYTYKPTEIIITENGASYADGPDASGRVRDIKRIEYFQTHIEAVGRAIASGVPVTGYYAWSLLDNFEWSFGYAQRFGLVYVDFETLKRYPKDSAYWYGNVARQNGLLPE
jgi:beta-glucosidase